MTPTTSTITRTRASRLTAAIAGTLLVLLTAQPAAALTWAGDAQLTAQPNFDPQILRTGPSSAISIWQTGVNVYARRTTDGGKTWKPQQTLTTGIFFSVSASSYGSKVDLAYVKTWKNADGSLAHRLFYRRSLDGGATWQGQRALTSTSSHIADQAVARDASGQVSIAWTGLYTGNIYMSTSTDGGTTFGAAKYVGHTDNSEIGRKLVYRGDPQLAIGTGVTYLAYTSAHDTLSVRRTLNRGTSWSAPVRFSGTAGNDHSIAASGSSAVVGWTSSATGMKAFYRRTTDKGTTWQATKYAVTVPAGSISMRLDFSYYAGVLAAVYKFGPPGASPVWYQESTNFGTTWSTKTRVSVVHIADSDPEPAGVAVLGATRLAGYNENREASGFWVRNSQ